LPIDQYAHRDVHRTARLLIFDVHRTARFLTFNIDRCALSLRAQA
jgi:hypothetical protein